MAATLIWLIIFIAWSECQMIEPRVSNSTRICKGTKYKSSEELKALEGCISVLGNITIFIENNNDTEYRNMIFDVREITEYLVIHRTRELESVGQLFPYLTRIRGVRLLYNFALMIFDNEQLREIGLYSLLKVDRGGVIIWLTPKACYMDTIDWNILVPKDRRVIAQSDKNVQCNIPCSCSLNVSTNHCWNNRKCQIFLDGPDAYKCNDQCLGCRNTKSDVCFVCRHYTYNWKCVTKCPSNTVIIPDNQYCITEDECRNLDRFVWNNTCLSDCPIGYVEKKNSSGKTICEICTNCQEVCQTLLIQSIESIEAAGRCVYINGSLIFHLRDVHGVAKALRTYMSQIQEVSDYILIEASDIRSLEFLQSLRHIKGNHLRGDKYSIDINNNRNLHTLFHPNVTKHLQIDQGTIRFEMNPKLCVNRIEETRKHLLNKTLTIEVHEGTNGYSGNCEEVKFKIELNFYNETSLKVSFFPVNHQAYYSILYARLPPEEQVTIVPESCNEFEWLVADVALKPNEDIGIVHLNSLRLASTYVFCVELYDPTKTQLTRSNLFNFTTPIGVPEPPFILELIASSSDAVVIRWVDHKDYVKSITRYEVDVALIDTNSKTFVAMNYCTYKDDLNDNDYSRHATVRRPPPEYGPGCESMCGILSTMTPGAMAEENFDVCDDASMKCGNEENIIERSTYFGTFVRTLIMNISAPSNVFSIGRLAPFSDYKFRLRACVNSTCSRSARGIVRTLHLRTADVPSIIYAFADDVGYIFIKWEPPKVSNGPVLTYFVEVIPRININDLLPKSWCVLANETEIMVKSIKTSKYLVRVCVQTLASSKSCGGWIKINASYKTSKTSFAMGAFCSIIIYITSIMFGWYWYRQKKPIDGIPLIDTASSIQVESEPPSQMFADLVPLELIPLR